MGTELQNILFFTSGHKCTVISWPIEKTLQHVNFWDQNNSTSVSRSI